MWSNDEKAAFQKLKEILTGRPLLALYGREVETELHTDTCKQRIGSILLKKQGDATLRSVCYYSRQTTETEQRYRSFELETLTVVVSVRQFRIYLFGILIKVVTDCNAIRATLTKRNLISRIGRWWLATQELDFTVEYRPGPRMAHADALSRNAYDTYRPFRAFCRE